MAAATVPRRQGSHRRWPIAEKRRLVELTLRPGASTRAIAREHGVHANTLSIWRRSYRAGKFAAKGATAPATASPGVDFVPVGVGPAKRKRSEGSVRNDAVEVVFSSGVTMRIESSALDTALVRALVAELGR